MGEPKSTSKPFASRGLVLKQDPALLSPDTYSELTNMVSPLEGNVTVRLGNQRTTPVGGFTTGTTGTIHTITHLRTGGIVAPLSETIYVGAGSTIYAVPGPPPLASASLEFAPVAGATAPAGPYSSQRFGSDDFPAGKNGTPFKFFGCPSAMLKGSGAIVNLQTWGILPPNDPVLPSITGSGVGPPVFTGAELPYTWVYTYVNGQTLAESNPCAFMVLPGVSPDGHQLRVPCAGTGDPQVSTINVYRAGGAFADGFYRFVGSANNPGAGIGIFFGDSATDTQIADNPLLQTDNDPPIPSTLRVPFETTVTGLNSVGGTGSFPGFNTLYLHVNSGSIDSLRVGSTMSIIDGSTGNTERCILAAVNSPPGTVFVFLQLPYTKDNSFIGCTVATGHPATIVLSAFDSIFVAGDVNNPHVLYKSKNGAPESFGVFNNEAQISDAINVGNPADAIMALVEYGGGVLSMNTKSLYFVSVSQGAMGIPTRSPALRGLFSQNAWTKVSNQIWYLAYDGVYSYAGGEEVWQSEAIDPLFRGEPSGPYLPVDMRQGLGTTGSDAITLSCNGTEVFVAYIDTAGTPCRARYHTVLKRWSIEQIGDASYLPNPLLPEMITAQYCEADSGKLYIAKQNQGGECGLFLDNSGYTDGWINFVSDGAPIPFAVTPAAISAPPSRDRLYSDFSLELDNTQENVQIGTFYNFSATPDGVDQYTAGPGPRRRVPFSFHSSSGVQAYGLTQRFSGTAAHPVSFHSITVNYWELAQFRHGLAFDWDDLGYPNEKTFRVLNLEIDTGGVAASLQLQADGVNFAAPLSVLSTSLDRNRIITLPDNFTARHVRMVINPGGGGATNYYKHSWEFFPEPPAVTFFDSYPITLFDGFSFVKQVWLQYTCSVGIAVTFYDGVGSLLYTIGLPGHPPPNRSTERFYLPVNNGSVLNKSKARRFTIETSDLGSAFKVYQDGSRIEYLRFGEAQREDYEQKTLTQIMAPQP